MEFRASLACKVVREAQEQIVVADGDDAKLGLRGPSRDRQLEGSPERFAAETDNSPKGSCHWLEEGRQHQRGAGGGQEPGEGLLLAHLIFLMASASSGVANGLL